MEMSASLKWSTSYYNNFFPCFGSFSCDISSQPSCEDQKSSLQFGPVQLFLLPMWYRGLPCSASNVSLGHPFSCIHLDEDTCVHCAALCAWRRKSILWFHFSNAIFSFVCDWESCFCHLFMPGGVMNYNWLLRVKLHDTAWASLEVQWCLQGSLTPSLSVPFPSLLPTILCFAILTSLLSWLCAFYDLAPSQGKLAQLVENQSREKKHFFSAVLVSWLLLV